MKNLSLPVKGYRLFAATLAMSVITIGLLTPFLFGSILELFEDNERFVVLHRVGKEWADFSGGLARDDKDFYTGNASLRITPNQVLISGFTIPIREKPAEGQYRYLTMAWKKKGGQYLILQLHWKVEGKDTFFCYYAGKPNWTPNRELSKDLPSDWVTYEGGAAIDLYKDLGEVDIWDIVFSPLDGEYALFDHIYFTSTIEEAKNLIQPQAYFGRRISEVAKKVQEVKQEVSSAGSKSKFVAKVRERVARIERDISSLRQRSSREGFVVSDKEFDQMAAQLAGYERELSEELIPLAKKTKFAALMERYYRISNPEYGIGFATTMEKIFRDEPYEGKVVKEVVISAARNETEGFQMVIIPFEKTLKDIQISISDLCQPDKTYSISSDKVEVSVVGYVKTDTPIYGIKPNRIGWWPDPLFPTRRLSEVKRNEGQPIWINISVPKDAFPGEYQGEITIAPVNSARVKVPLKLIVYDFTLPVTPHLKTAFTFSECMVEQWYMTQLPEEIRKKWYLFILRHKLNVQTLYPSNEAYYSYRNLFVPVTVVPFEDGIIPRKQDMDFCVENGLNLFNVGVGYPELARQEKLSDFNKKLEAHLKDYSKYLAERNWSEKGFLYAFDEIFTQNEEDLRRARDFLVQLKTWAPSLKRAATLRIDKQTIEKMSGYLDIYIPLSSHYDPELFREIRAQGAEAWWYVCCVPTDPWPTFAIIESPALDARIFFWMNWKYQVPGVLYHNLNWYGKNIRQNGKRRWPDVPWITQEVDGYNGDGYLIYPGPDMTPLSSIRLENVRDGIEDYEYFCILRELLDSFRKKNPADKETVASLEKLLIIEDEIASSQTEHTRDPERLLRKRAELAAAIERLQRLITLRK